VKRTRITAHLVMENGGVACGATSLRGPTPFGTNDLGAVTCGNCRATKLFNKITAQVDYDEYCERNGAYERARARGWED
jgi:hypothetical protein